jgi:hypothetical protein
MEVGPSSRTMEKGHLPLSHFLVHGVNRPLIEATIGMAYKMEKQIFKEIALSWSSHEAKFLVQGFEVVQKT